MELVFDIPCAVKGDRRKRDGLCFRRIKIYLTGAICLARGGQHESGKGSAIGIELPAMGMPQVNLNLARMGTIR